MGDYASMRIEGIVTPHLRHPLQNFFEQTITSRTMMSNREELARAWIEVFPKDSLAQYTAEALTRLDRWSFCLFGSLAAYGPDEWKDMDEERNKVGPDGWLRVISSSKNRETQLFFKDCMVPFLFISTTFKDVTELM